MENFIHQEREERHLEEFKPKIPLWQHQKDALERIKRTNQFALFFEMGTGKTATAINAFRYWSQREGKVLKTLVLCPPIVVRNWGLEFMTHSHLNPKEILCLQGSQINRIKSFKFAEAFTPVMITNYEALLMNDLFQEFMSWSPEVIIFDESHRLKNYRAKRTKQALRLSTKARYKLILSGTPVLNTPMDLFTQYKILDGGRTFGENFFAFRNRYFYDKNSGMPTQRYFPLWVPRADTFETFNNKVKETAAHAKKEECLDLPPLVRKPIYMDLSAKQLKAYQALKKNFIAEVEGGHCVARLAITKALRLQEIVSGYITTESSEGERKNSFKDNPRAEALRELLSELTPHSKVLVWAVFKKNYETIRQVCAQIGVRYVEIHGEVSSKNRDLALDEFNNVDDVRVFIGHPGSGGIGINLVSASYSIFYSRGFSLEYDIQAEARNYRAGAEVHSKITRIDLVAPNTIDEFILKKLKDKQEIGDKILGDLITQLKEENDY